MEGYLLGIDCGLTLIKAAVFTFKGDKLREAQHHTPLVNNQVDTETLWQSTCNCIMEAVGEYKIAACSLAGHGNGLYALNEGGKIIAAYSSMIDSFAPSVENVDLFFDITHQSCWSGQPMQILKHLKDTQRDLYLKICTVLQCKDYIRYRLTGELALEYSDASAAALLDNKTSVGSRELLDIIGIPEMAHVFPPLVSSFDIAGNVTSEASICTGLAQGTPVASGLFDVNACMLGAGVTDGTRYSVTAGTWGITTIPTVESVQNQIITQSCNFCDRDRYMAIVSAPTSCVNLDWFLHNFLPDITYEEAGRVAASFGPDDVEIIYLPFLHADMRYRDVTASFNYIKAKHTWHEMLRAVYEGVVFSHRLQLERMQKAGLFADAIRLSGGASKGMMWRKLFADILNLPIETVKEKQVGTLGAAIVASVSVGMYNNYSEAVKQMTKIDEVIFPTASGAYDRKYAQFKRLVGVEV